VIEAYENQVYNHGGWSAALERSEVKDAGIKVTNMQSEMMAMQTDLQLSFEQQMQTEMMAMQTNFKTDLLKQIKEIMGANNEQPQGQQDSGFN